MEEIIMDKNNCDNNSYFYERNYYKDVPIKDTQILEYWNNILGKDVIELIDKENLEEMMKQKNIKTIIRDFLVMISI